MSWKRAGCPGNDPETCPLVSRQNAVLVFQFQFSATAFNRARFIAATFFTGLGVVIAFLHNLDLQPAVRTPINLSFFHFVTISHGKPPE
jgi:hypothetical protein